MEIEPKFRRALNGGLVIGFATVPAWFIIYVVAGVFTGVFGMCQTASASWVSLYETGFFVVPPLLGLITGVLVYKKIGVQDLEKLP